MPVYTVLKDESGRGGIRESCNSSITHTHIRTHVLQKCIHLLPLLLQSNQLLSNPIRPTEAFHLESSGRVDYAHGRWGTNQSVYVCTCVGVAVKAKSVCVCICVYIHACALVYVCASTHLHSCCLCGSVHLCRLRCAVCVCVYVCGWFHPLFWPRWSTANHTDWTSESFPQHCNSLETEKKPHSSCVLRLRSDLFYILMMNLLICLQSVSKEEKLLCFVTRWTQWRHRADRQHLKSGSEHRWKEKSRFLLV